MFTYDDLRTFITSFADPANFDLRTCIDSLAKSLEAHVTLIDNSGFIIYRKTVAIPGSPEDVCAPLLYRVTADLVYKKRLQNVVNIWVNGRSLGAIVVEKKILSPTERILLEIASGIISVNMQ